jgi:hypothetical protein
MPRGAKSIAVTTACPISFFIVLSPEKLEVTPSSKSRYQGRLLNMQPIHAMRPKPASDALKKHFLRATLAFF